MARIKTNIEAEKGKGMERSDTGVRSVQLAMDVLEAVVFSGEELGVTQLAERLGVTKGSVHRHLTTLVDRGYLVQNPVTTRYGIGPKCRLLASIAPETDMKRVAENTMRELRDLLGHSVVLSSMSPRGALVVQTIANTSPIEIGVRIGSELPFAQSAQGLVLLAFATRPFQERVLSQPIPKMTSKSLGTREEVEQELTRVFRQGYCCAPEKALIGINAIAAPIFDERDNCVAVLAIVGSIQYLPEKPDAKTIEALKQAAMQISRKLGHSGAAVPERGGKRGAKRPSGRRT